MQNTWIVVADESRGRIFNAPDREGGIIEVETLIHSQSKLPEKTLGTHTRGTFQTQHGTEQHGLNTKGKLKDHQAESFAKDIVAKLNQARDQQQFVNLIIVAAPRFLGVLRKELSAPLSKLVGYELDKDLTKFSIKDIRQHLPRHLPRHLPTH